MLQPNNHAKEKSEKFIRRRSMDVFTKIFDAIAEIAGILKIDFDFTGIKDTVDQIIAVIEGLEF